MDEINEKIQNAYEKSILERKFDLGSGHKGHGITVWNRAREVHGDYETVAHVDRNRKIKYYIKNPPKQVKDYVEKIAKGSNPNVSTTQSQKVFNEMDKSDFESYKKIVMRLIVANFKKFGDMKKAKKATFDALDKQSSLVLNAFIKKAMSLKDDDTLDGIELSEEDLKE